ncbi:hypothetical protein N7540_002715 [Penicillium herquei]|nr:hypothetical protein N7540_002715 [Penicillium herquei]
MSLIELTRAIHDETTDILSVREQLRAHMSVIARFLRLQYVTATQPLTERVREYSEDITYQEETSQVILRHLENMNSLATMAEEKEGQGAQNLV